MACMTWANWSLAGLLLLGPASAFGAEPPPCPASQVPPLSVAALREAVARNQSVAIVALGSSSTAGSHASDIAHSYPAVLQAELQAALPGSHIAVLNRGVGGQDAAEMLPRIERDAVNLRPALVIWQVGANGAMRHTDPDLFKRLVESGLKRLHNARIDVVLMDNQRAPAILASPEHIRIDQALADVAVSQGAGLFDRAALMDQWRRDGFPYEQFISEDGIHHNDQGYRCVAKALAAALVRGIGPVSPTGSLQAARAQR